MTRIWRRATWNPGIVWCDARPPCARTATRMMASGRPASCDICGKRGHVSRSQSPLHFDVKNSFPGGHFWCNNCSKTNKHVRSIEVCTTQLLATLFYCSHIFILTKCRHILTLLTTFRPQTPSSPHFHSACRSQEKEAVDRSRSKRWGEFFGRVSRIAVIFRIDDTRNSVWKPTFPAQP